MIKINKQDCPVELTDELKTQLTQEYSRSGKSVWKQHFIEKTLLKSSYNKCCYCECKIDRESKYMEVEHYHDKNRYPHLVVEWDNLLPSCKRCNGNKSSYDTVNNSFINPSKMNPKDHLIISSYRLFPKTLNGKNTIDELLLNDHRRLVLPRFDITEAVLIQIDQLFVDALEFSNGTRRTGQNRKRILSTMENLLYEALPDSEYAATVATAMVNNVSFLEIIQILKNEHLWTSEMENMYKQIENIALDTDINIAKEFLKGIIFKVS